MIWRRSSAWRRAEVRQLCDAAILLESLDRWGGEAALDAAGRRFRFCALGRAGAKAFAGARFPRPAAVALSSRPWFFRLRLDAERAARACRNSVRSRRTDGGGIVSADAAARTAKLFHGHRARRARSYCHCDARRRLVAALLAAATPQRPTGSDPAIMSMACVTTSTRQRNRGCAALTASVGTQSERRVRQRSGDGNRGAIAGAKRRQGRRLHRRAARKVTTGPIEEIASATRGRSPPRPPRCIRTSNTC